MYYLWRWEQEYIHVHVPHEQDYTCTVNHKIPVWISLRNKQNLMLLVQIYYLHMLESRSTQGFIETSLGFLGLEYDYRLTPYMYQVIYSPSLTNPMCMLITTSLELKVKCWSIRTHKYTRSDWNFRRNTLACTLCKILSTLLFGIPPSYRAKL